MAKENHHREVPFWALLTNANFMFLWFSQALSMLAVNILTFMLLAEVYKLSGSSLATGGLALSFSVPSFIFAAIAGVVADRVNRKTILVVSNLVRTLLIFAVLLPFSNNLPLVYFFAFAISVATQFFMPAEAASIPSLVNKQELVLANSLFMVTMYGALVVGYALAGPLILLFGTKNLILVLGVLFGTATFFDIFIFSKNLHSEEFVKSSYTNVWREIWRGWKTVRQKRDILHPVLHLGALWALIGMLFVLLPAFVKSVIGIEVESASLVFIAPTGIGLVLGVIVLNLLKKIKLEKLIVFGFIMAGLMVVLMSLYQPLREFVGQTQFYSEHPIIFEKIRIRPIAMTIAGLIGFFAAFIMIPAQTLIQQRATEDIRGRVFGLLNTFIAFAGTVPVIIAGVLGDLITVNYAFMVIGFFAIVYGFLEWVSQGLYLKKSQ